MTNNLAIASYNGSQKGFTVRDLNLEQISFTALDAEINSIAAGANGDLYIAAANHLYHYKVDGTLIKDMTFPDDHIQYTSVAIKGDKIFAAYEGSQVGVTVRDLDLNQLSWFATSYTANGMAAGNNDDLYIASKNHIYHVKTNGEQLQDMVFPSNSINYTDVSVLGDLIFASYNGSQQGFTVRDSSLNQLSYANVAGDISGIAAGPDNNVYLSSENHIYNYAKDGTLIADLNFPVSSINYTSVSLVFLSLT
jgi:hypothetical protein